jgi:cation transport regulator ChaC
MALTYLFSYGSNHPGQLAERLRHPVLTLPAYAPGWQRVFRGMSRTWGGGVASLVKKRGATTYGLAIRVTPADLETLDRYEGVPFAYQRKTIELVIGDERKRAIAYIARSRTHNPPTPAYLENVAKTISAHWAGAAGGLVLPEEIPIR